MSYISSNRKLLLSKIATNDGHAEKSSYFDGWKAYDKNPFHPTQNPNGVIQMGLAEHQVKEREEKWIGKELARSSSFSKRGSFTESSKSELYSPIRSFVSIWFKNGLWTTQKPPFALRKEGTSSGTLPSFRTIMACLSSETYVWANQFNVPLFFSVPKSVHYTVNHCVKRNVRAWWPDRSLRPWFFAGCGKVYGESERGQGQVWAWPDCHERGSHRSTRADHILPGWSWWCILGANPLLSRVRFLIIFCFPI